MSTGQIRIQKLLIVSPARRYEVNFSAGVNVISGPIYTGKSSIFKLIDYAFGAKNPPGFDELGHCSDVFLEFLISDEIVTLSRSLKSSTAPINLFNHCIEDILRENYAPEEISHKTDANKESVTTVLLKRLGLDDTRLKIAPTQDASKTHTFSFRDFLRTFYIDQERVGSSSAFFERDFVKRIKFVQTLEIVLGLHDDRKVLLSKQIADAEADEANIERELAANRKFLNEMKIPLIDDLEAKILAVDQERKDLQAATAKLQDRTSAALGENAKLVRDRNSIQALINRYNAKQNEIERSLKNLARLQVQYQRELRQLEFLGESNSLLGTLPVVVCPACFQKIDSSEGGEVCGVCCKSLPVADGETYVNSRLRAIRARIKDLHQYIEQVTQEQNGITDEVERLRKIREKLDYDISRISQSYSLPETQEAVGIERRIAQIEEEKIRFREWIDLRRRALGDGSRLSTVRDRLTKLRSDLGSIKVDQESRDEVIADLSTRLRSFLEGIPFSFLCSRSFAGLGLSLCFQSGL